MAWVMDGWEGAEPGEVVVRAVIGTLDHVEVVRGDQVGFVARRIRPRREHGKGWQYPARESWGPDPREALRSLGLEELWPTG